ncbi:MAG: hypothetical protein WCP96_07395 [Methylococcaceae bacterium]
MDNDELLTGKYHEQFEQLMPEELLQEGMQIRETIKTCFEISQEDADYLILDAKKRHALLEITIREAKSHKSSVTLRRDKAALDFACSQAELAHQITESIHTVPA